jgi:Bacterial SH3 domain
MKLSRRELIIGIGGGAIVSMTSSCGLIRVVIRITPTITKIAGVLLGVADGILTIRDIYKEVEKTFEIQLDEPQVSQLINKGNLIIIDNSQNQFTPKFTQCEAVGKTRDRFRGDPLNLFDKPNTSANVLKSLKVGESVGVFDLRYGSSTGWYHIETLPSKDSESGERGWISGYCLERLPFKK